MKESVLMNEKEVEECIRTLADMIVRRNPSLKNTALLGIQTRGPIVAERIAAQIEEITGVRPNTGSIDTRPFRDDIKFKGKDKSKIPFNVDNMDVILVDDVLYTGRTMRAAMDAVIEHGRPASIRIAILIDRGHREYPITADYVGKVIPTSSKETVRLKVKEIDDGKDRVIVKTG
jgi:pyrimidine operon attenuation protein/uracil phosphoribosyltransferase